MLRNPKLAVVFVSAYLAAYCIILLAGYGNLASVMFMLSPALVIWMVITVLKQGKYTGTPLIKQDEEWGYEDKKRESLHDY